MTTEKKAAPSAKDILAQAEAQEAPRPIDPLNKVRIDDVEYDFTTLPQEAKELLGRMQAADQEIARQKALVAVLYYARQNYGLQLSTILPEIAADSVSQ